MTKVERKVKQKEYGVVGDDETGGEEKKRKDEEPVMV